MIIERTYRKDKKMGKRIFWLFNHTSLRKFELPLLREMGYEIYCPKIYDFEAGDYSASVTYEYDASLTIPTDVLEKLNQTSFYHAISEEIMQLLNEYFDIAFCMAACEPFVSIVRGFKGAVVLHAFGLAYPHTYTELLSASENAGFFSEIEKLKNRFWFAPTYDNLAEIESPLFRRNTVFLPIGLENTSITDTWEGGKEKILFVSPKIKTNSFYHKVYKDFCRDFGDLPHVIGGAQPQPVPEDPSVSGFLSAEEYNDNMDHLAAMYYHSREPYHLHYHPLEAIKRGMPLVFMSGGMLDHLGGKGLPGSCKTISQARNKLKRLLKGDKTLIREIKESQTVLLKPFTKEFCMPHWIEGMRRIEASIPTRDECQATQKKRIAVIMPNAYTGGVLDYTVRFVLNLNHEILAHQDNAEIVLAHPDLPVYEGKDYFRAVEAAGIPVRRFTVEEKNAAWIERAYSLAGYQPEGQKLPSPNKMSVLNDGIGYFQDCDYVILTADRTNLVYPIFCLKPYAVVAHDYIQRYVSEAVGAADNAAILYNQRHANAVLVTSVPTQTDAIQYGGLNPEKVYLTPLMLEMMKPSKMKEEAGAAYERGSYFLWSTNLSPHKNHLLALRALESYYRNGGELNCLMTGANTHYLDPEQKMSDSLSEYAEKVRTYIASSSVLRRRIKVLGEIPKAEYAHILANAAFVFHPGYGDNGNGTVMDAAGLGIPSLSSDYPAMRYLAEYMGISMHYTSFYDAEMMAEALMDMEKNHADYAAELPSREAMQKNEYRGRSAELYACIKKIVGF